MIKDLIVSDPIFRCAIFRSGGKNPVRDGLAFCQERYSGKTCEVYAVNNEMVLK